MGHVTTIKPQWVGTNYDEPACQKFEVSTFTHYEDMKGDEKCKNWGGLEVRGHARSSTT